MGGMSMLRASKTEREQMRIEALGCLGAVRNLRLTRESVIEGAIRFYGWTGPLISGCEQEHWPEDIKDTLRVNAREIGQAMVDGMNLWLKSGRKSHTYRELAYSQRYENGRVINSRY